MTSTSATTKVLPGVGAFAAAAERLSPGRDAMREALEAGLPCLGICLGMQLLFDGSDEGPGAGLGVIGGRVERLRAAGQTAPGRLGRGPGRAVRRGWCREKHLIGHDRPQYRSRYQRDYVGR